MWKEIDGVKVKSVVPKTYVYTGSIFYSYVSPLYETEKGTKYFPQTNVNTGHKRLVKLTNQKTITKTSYDDKWREKREKDRQDKIKRKECLKDCKNKDLKDKKEKSKCRNSCFR
jgi:hypothetical protein